MLFDHLWYVIDKFDLELTLFVGACEKTIQYLCDTVSGFQITKIELDYPVSDDEIAGSDGRNYISPRRPFPVGTSLQAMSPTQCLQPRRCRARSNSNPRGHIQNSARLLRFEPPQVELRSSWMCAPVCSTSPPTLIALHPHRSRICQYLTTFRAQSSSNKSRGTVGYRT